MNEDNINNNERMIIPNYVEVMIEWKKKNKSRVYKTSIDSFESYKGAISALLSLKGGFEKIDILSVQDFNKNLNQCINDPIMADDKDSIIYKMYKEWEENNINNAE